MALRLEVISDQRERLGDRSRIVLGVSGGSIGRALDNDWVLPDTLRYLSGHHARIHFRQGAWYLEDLSTNGVYVNDAVNALGRRSPYALHSGDVLRFGEYRVQVSIEAEKPLPPPGTGTLQQMSVDNVVPLHIAPEGADDLGASLNIEALIPDVIPELGPRGDSTLSAQQRLSQFRSSDRARRSGRVGPLAAPEPRNAFQAFCRGAGIDPNRLPAESEVRLMHLAGQLMREALLGLKELMRTQQSFRERYHIEGDKETGIHSPLERATDEYLQQLLVGHDRHDLDAVIQWRTLFRGVSDHVAALDPALRSALTQFLGHLAPANIEAPLADRGSSANPAASWERYRDVYMNLLHATGQELPHLFTEALTQAYGREVDNQSIQTFRRSQE